jgi:hypothetical protein
MLLSIGPTILSLIWLLEGHHDISVMGLPPNLGLISHKELLPNSMIKRVNGGLLGVT